MPYTYIIYYTRFVGLKSVSAAVADEVTSTVSQKKRRCVAEGEVQLNYSSRYSQSSCVVECTARKMREVCSCRPYFLRGIVY